MVIMTDAEERVREIKETYCNNLPKPEADCPPKVQWAVTYIHKHLFDRELSVRQLKEQCRINGNNFSGTFRYYVGGSPKQFWLEHRIAVAKELLREDSLSEVPLIETAFSLGFRGHSSFTATFKN